MKSRCPNPPDPRTNETEHGQVSISGQLDPADDVSVRAAPVIAVPTDDQALARQFLERTQSNETLWGYILSHLSDEALQSLMRQIGDTLYHRALGQQLNGYRELDNHKAFRLQLWSKLFGLAAGAVICPLCEISMLYQGASDWHCAHVIPKSKGGKLTIDNLRIVCATCNSNMGTMNLIDYARTIQGALERMFLTDLSQISD